MKHIDYYWRLFGTTLSFLVFGIAALCMELIFFPLMFICLRNRESRTIKVRQVIGKLFGLFVWMTKSLGVLDHRICGYEHIQKGRNALIVANHPTLFDVVILISLFPQANCVIKGAVTRNPFMRGIARAAAYLSNSAPEELLVACIDYLRSGGSLVLFPEGTRTSLDDKIHFKPGAAAIATRSNVCIVPVAIHCKPAFLNKEVSWHYVPPNRPIYTIRILPPVAVADLVDVAGKERLVRNNLNSALLNIIRRELDEIQNDDSLEGQRQSV